MQTPSLQEVITKPIVTKGRQSVDSCTETPDLKLSEPRELSPTSPQPAPTPRCPRQARCGCSSLPCTLVSQESPVGHHHRRHHRDCRRSAEPRGLWETPSPGGAQHEVQLGGGDAGETASPPHQGSFRQRTPAESLGPLRVTAQGCSRSEAGEHRRSGERRRQPLELLPAVLSAQGSRAHVEANEAEGAAEHRPARWTLGLGTGDEVEVTGARGMPAAQGGPPPRLYRTCSLPRARRPHPAGHVPRSCMAYTFQVGLSGSPDSAHPSVPTAASAKRDEV